MTVKLNETAFEHAKALIDEGDVVVDERDDWSEHQPSSSDENSFIEKHGMREYAKWHLGIEVEEAEENKSKYKFPYGDFAKVHRCGILAAESRAGQYRYADIERATAHLHGMIERRGARVGRD